MTVAVVHAAPPTNRAMPVTHGTASSPTSDHGDDEHERRHRDGPVARQRGVDPRAQHRRADGADPEAAEQDAVRARAHVELVAHDDRQEGGIAAAGVAKASVRTRIPRSAGALTP